MTLPLYENSMTSKAYPIFCEFGYPELDAVFYEDGEWAIIQYENAPLVPSLTRWRVVLSGFQNIEFNRSFAKRLIDMIDLRKREFWERLEREEAERARHDEALMNERADAVLKASETLAKNDAFMERVARTGQEAFSLNSALKSLSSEQLRRELGPQVRHFL